MGRQIADPKYLLDTDADQNIGNSTDLVPEPGAGGTTQVQTNPPRLLSLDGPSKQGEMTSVIFTASRKPNVTGIAGPVTGIIEFGNGGRFTRIEVDVPVGPYQGIQLVPSNTTAVEPQDGGTIVSVPTGVLRTYCRYDNRLIQPNSDAAPPYSIAEVAGVPLRGPGGTSDTLNPATLLVKSMAAHYSKVWNRAYRTQYLYLGAGIAIPATFYRIPMLAKSLQIARSSAAGPLAAGLDITLSDGGGLALDFISIAAGTRSPIIPIVGQMVGITISTIAPSTVTFLSLIYEIGI